MGKGFLEWVAGIDPAGGGAGDEFNSKPSVGHGYSIAPGTVMESVNFLSEGRVQVHIPAVPALDPWARLSAIGGGSGRGFLWVPEKGDEVLVAFNANDERDAYILGGLWSMTKRPPVTLPTEFIAKRVLYTGKKGSPLSHQIEFDDALQSITITSSMGQQIKLDQTSIEISAVKGTRKITLGPTSISIQAQPAGNIELSAPGGKISLLAAEVDIQATTSASLQGTTACSIQSPVVKIN
ncbi:MAG TPA: phage baseplate assembly protein V [Candidatus Solibacter sp.]|nr:phage baseplate assembly protein V [Candidatus Solibacter sp.]